MPDRADNRFGGAKPTPSPRSPLHIAPSLRTIRRRRSAVPRNFSKTRWQIPLPGIRTRVTKVPPQNARAWFVALPFGTHSLFYSPRHFSRVTRANTAINTVRVQCVSSSSSYGLSGAHSLPGVFHRHPSISAGWTRGGGFFRNRSKASDFHETV